MALNQVISLGYLFEFNKTVSWFDVIPDIMKATHAQIALPGDKEMIGYLMMSNIHNIDLSRIIHIVINSKYLAPLLHIPVGEQDIEVHKKALERSYGHEFYIQIMTALKTHGVSIDDIVDDVNDTNIYYVTSLDIDNIDENINRATAYADADADADADIYYYHSNNYYNNDHSNNGNHYIASIKCASVHDIHMICKYKTCNVVLSRLLYENNETYLEFNATQISTLNKFQDILLQWIDNKEIALLKMLINNDDLVMVLLNDHEIHAKIHKYFSDTALSIVNRECSPEKILALCEGNGDEEIDDIICKHTAQVDAQTLFVKSFGWRIRKYSKTKLIGPFGGSMMISEWVPYK